MAKDQNSEAAKKVADAEKASKKKAGKNGEPNVFVRIGKAIAKFFKDLKGENKKIVWPNAKSVWKNTGIVFAVVLLIGVGIWVIDWGLSAGVDAVLGINVGEESTVEETAEAATTVANVATTAAEAVTAEGATEAVSEEAVSEEAASQEAVTEAASQAPATESSSAAE